MKKHKLRTIAMALICTVALGSVPSNQKTSDFLENPALTTTVQAATRSLSLKVSNTKTYVGKSVKLNVKTTKGAKLGYTISNRSIATVNSHGTVTGKKAGTVKITVSAKRSGYKMVKRTITVKIYRQNQNVTAANVKLTVGHRKRLSAKARTGLSYKSSNPKIVTIDKKGYLTAKAAGTAKITVTAATSNTFNSASHTITVTVKKPTISAKPSATPLPSKKPEPTNTPKPTNTPAPTIIPEPDVSYVTELSLDKTSRDTLYVGTNMECMIKWKATGNTTRKDFIYVSSDPSVATIDEEGIMTPLNAGKIKITVTSKTPFTKNGTCLYDSKKYTVEIPHNDLYRGGVGFLNPEEVDTKGRNVRIGETINPNAGLEKYSPENAEKYLEFTSSDPSIATIDAQGNITGVSNGYVTFTVKTKLPVDPAGKYYKEGSTTYHVGDYTYEEILDGLTIDMEASKTAHDVLNELRQDKSKRPAVTQNYPEVPARVWCDACYQESAVRGSRNIICSILKNWNTGEASSINPLATHGGNQNGYGCDGWNATGTELGYAAKEFFYDGGHAANQTNAKDNYSATAVVQYKNAAGINLTSIIVTMSPYSYEKEVANADSNSTTWVEDSIKGIYVPSSQYYDICRHFGLNWGMEINNTVSETSFADGDNLFTDGSINPKDEADTTQAESAVPDNKEMESVENVSEEIDIDQPISFESTEEDIDIDIESDFK